MPTPTITGANVVCAGTTGVTYTTQALMTGYAWSVSAGGIITAGLGTNVITVTWNIAGPQTVSVNYSNSFGCPAVPPTTYAVTVNAQPIPIISGPTSVCVTSTGNVYTTQTNMTGYIWNISSGGVITAGLGTNAITVTWNTSGPQWVSVNYTNANFCTAAAPTVYNVTVNALPLPTITGPTPVCVNSTGNVYTTQTNMTGYVWTVSAGGSITAGGGSGNNTVTVTWNATGPQSVSVKYTNANGCTAAAPTVYNITVNGLPLPTITGPTPVCAASTGNVYTTQASMTNYVWAVSAGGSITAGGTSTSNTVTVNWNTAGAQTVSVNFTNGNGCTAAAPTVYNVTVNPLPVPTITGPSSVCINSAGNVYTTQASMTNYVWTVSSGGSITAGGGSGNNTVTVTWNTTGAQSVSVKYTNANGCTAAAPTVYNVTVNPLPVPTISGSTPVCVGVSGITYSTESGMTNYTWTISSGGSIVSGQGTYQIQVAWNASGSQWVAVNYTSAAGCTATSPTQFNVTILSAPGAAGPITGTSVVCAGAQGVAYSVAPITNATSYYWNLPPGATFASGNGSNSITVDFGANATSGNITVSGNNICGNGAMSPPFPVTVNALPAAAGSITGPTNVCQGSAGIVYSVPVIQYATGYTWSIPPGASIVSGGNTNAITVNFSMAATSGDITVFGTNSCGSGSVSPVFAVTVNPKPAKPTVTANGNTLTSSAPSGNQWYWNGVVVAGATQQTYIVPPANSGYYWTIVTLNGCSSDSSNHVYVAGVGIQENETLSFNVYPVPNDGLFTAEVSSSYEDAYRILIYNTLGEMVYSTGEFRVNGTYKETIDVRKLPSGIYSVVFTNDQRKVVRKIFINK
jgi:hypothetical protein